MGLRSISNSRVTVKSAVEDVVFRGARRDGAICSHQNRVVVRCEVDVAVVAANARVERPIAARLTR